MAAAMGPQKMSDAIMAFALDGRFPEDASELPPVSGTDLQPTIESLDRAKSDLQSEIHKINEETKEDVSSWVRNAKTLQDDIIRSKSMANDIVRQSEAPDVSGEAVQDAEDKIEFLNREVQYSQQLHGVLKGIQRVNRTLADVEQALSERRILDALRLLEASWSAMDEVGASKSCRAMRLLDTRAFELKSAVHDAFNQIWKSMVHAGVDSARIIIRDTAEEAKMSFEEAVIGLKAYKEVDERVEQLWHNLDTTIVSPRMDTQATPLRRVASGPDELRLDGEADPSIDALLNDLETVITFIANKLPDDLLQTFSKLMMADLVPKLISQWLDSGVPSALKDMDKFQSVIQRAQQFCTILQDKGYTGFDELKNWVDKAPMIWLGKCRDTALDTVRSRLVRGIGKPKQVEKVEKHMVTVSEGRELATTGAGAAADTNDWNEDWGEAWNEDEEKAGQEPNNDHRPTDDQEASNDDDTNAWGWDDDANGQDATDNPEAQGGDDDGTDAWGWGDEGATAEPEPKPAKPSKPPKPSRQPNQQQQQQPRQEETRELILKETYNISSMPEPFLDLIFAVLEDGAALTQENGEYALVAGTAAGLFSLPTLALALFRAISPHYYSLDVGGGMFLYNDAMYIAEQLTEFGAKWKEREDISARAKTMLRLDNDIKTLQNFANRSYGNEMNIQKTILNDLLGDSQSIMQHDEMESAVEAGTTRIRTMAATWESILARSVWSQAIGSLADTLASRLIRDVLEMPSIGQEEAYSIAKLIAASTELDDLFLPSKLSGGEPEEDEVPATAQYAPSWLRLKYLSEVLQSNLNEVKYLWCDSELSLYFTVEEVVDLVQASFEDNPRTRETIREIRAKQPL